MGSRQVGLVVAVAGIAIAVVGGLIRLGAFSWFGKLPGDIRIEGEHTRVYVPLASCVLISLVASAIWYLVRRLW